MVDDLGVGLVEALGEVGLSHGQADGVADTLAQGTCGAGGRGFGSAPPGGIEAGGRGARGGE